MSVKDKEERRLIGDLIKSIVDLQKCVLYAAERVEWSEGITLSSLDELHYSITKGDL